ncbi:STAS-like domain-containing protein [Deinococcus taeanensis]|uniref:STAS-like domain-containing protein n=1 Tax=Deinococcus taeanensis TaxID=2737050 RepID=UPI001CDBF120|nr:STAS-like domain-containing protein [Deinococcus taeanensis]UBV43255.1 STAS-like domain-containing protein [Deinococcus taeanensis]
MTNSSRETETIRIVDVVDTDICVTQADGERVFKRIYSAFQRGSNVVLSFRDVRFIISAFLNPAIGMLYKYYDSRYLNENLKVIDITVDQRAMVREVLRNAKEYYENQAEVNNSLNEAMNGEL